MVKPAGDSGGSAGSRRPPGAAAAYRARASQAVARDTRRSRQLDWQATRRPAWVMWVSAVCTALLVLAVVALSQSDRTSRVPLPMGDQLGPIGMEGREYQQFADRQLASMQGEEPRWALITPDAPWDAGGLKAALGDVPGRVSTLLVGPNVQWVLPEPVAGHTRAEVFDRALADLSAKAGLRPGDPRRVVVNGVLIRATPDVLRGVDAKTGVRLVEPADPGAIYGRMGVRADVPPQDAAPDVGGSVDLDGVLRTGGQNQYSGAL
ncbi:hypothetical protein [Corynebacterium heidelbergense]|uniref:hypothetical protein n=1 Tax=Corynebacterium heidelbergense TaxID=2055947 RepID=UPI0018753593|nr:hypothetical protein [Corynebacterium heidelbergense]